MAVNMALLQDEMATLLAEREDLRKKNPGQRMPTEATVRDGQIVERVQKLQVAIDEEQTRQNDVLMREVARYMDDPLTRVTHPVNADDDGRKTLMAAGWEFRGGMIVRNTSRGPFAYLPEEVMIGPMPSAQTDPVAADFFRQSRQSFQPDYRAAFIRYIKVKGQLGMLSSQEQNALSEGVAAEGGFTVPADIQAEMLVRRADASPMRRLATVRQTSRDRMQWPAVVPNATSASIYSSGFVGGLVGERAVNTDVGPTFQQFEIAIKDFEAYTKLTNNLINDSASDMLAFLSADGGTNLGLVEEYYFLNGIGTGLEPMGILNAGLTTFDVEGTTSNNVSNTISDMGSAPKIIAGSYLVPAQYADRGSWLMARQTKGEVHGLIGADGRPWWQDAAAAGGQAGAPSTLVGMPVYTSPFMPLDNTNTNKVMLVGDLSAYIIADRQALTVIVDPINLVGSNETQIFIRSRAGGGMWNTDAVRVGIV